jgi:hypothetical protein
VRAEREQAQDLDEVTRRVTEHSRSAMGRAVAEDAIERMEQTTSYRMNTSGYMRYFDKHADSR